MNNPEINVGEIHVWVNSAIDYFIAMSKRVNEIEYDSEYTQEDLEDALFKLQVYVDYVFKQFNFTNSMMAYIVSTEFNGEYIISPYDMKNIVIPAHYNVKTINNPDGSFELNTLRIPYEEDK